MSKPKPPPAPNYAAAAAAQGEANLNSGLATNYLNQVNQVGPNGSLTFANNGNDLTLKDGTVIPGRTATTTLSPAQQMLLDQNNQISGQLNNVASQGIGYVGQAMGQPISDAGMPSLSGGLARTNFGGSAAPAGDIQNQYDFTNASAAPTLESFAGARDQITNAYLARNQPQMDRQGDAMRNRLANQGITMGSEAYGADSDAFGRQENDMRMAAMLAGDQQQRSLFGEAMALRNQGTGEAMQQGQFGNNAQGQRFSQNQQDLQNTNTAAQANFGQGLAAAQFGNAARGQAMQEADYFRNAPLNMVNALRTGNQVNMPQFGNVASGAQISPAPVYQAASDQYSAAMGQYQARLQQSNSMMQGMATIGSTAGMVAMSDRRLKRNIQAIGKRFDGLMLYAWDYIWGESAVGVMADEVVMLRPEALGPVIRGYATVDYGVLNA